MSYRVISVVQLEPGIGKTTIATNLAGELSKVHHVALLDCDPLGRCAAKWGAQREAVVHSERLIVQPAGTPLALLERAYRLRGAVQYIVCDGPPIDLEMNRAMAAIAHLCLLPAPPTDTDRRCTAIVDALRQARQRRSFRVRAVTIGQSQRRYREPAALRLAKVVSTILCERHVYATALENGRTASEYGDPVARDELHKLAMEVMSLVPLTSERDQSAAIR